VDSRFRLVLICTGNRFRSPIAEGLIRELTPTVPLEVSSLGLLDLPEAPPLDEALEEAAALGIDISAHRARRLATESLGEPDLVLGFERIHVAEAVVHAGAPRERTFTLPELVELLEVAEAATVEDPVEHARAAVRAAEERRAALPPDTPLPELPDPWGRPRAAYGEIASSVADYSRRLVARLFGVNTPSRRV
jgi:protein-tyrosine phosphatase